MGVTLLIFITIIIIEFIGGQPFLPSRSGYKQDSMWIPQRWEVSTYAHHSFLSVKALFKAIVALVNFFSVVIRSKSEIE